MWLVGIRIKFGVVGILVGMWIKFGVVLVHIPYYRKLSRFNGK